MSSPMYEYIVRRFLSEYGEWSKENLEAFLEGIYVAKSYSFYNLAYCALKRYARDNGLNWDVKRIRGQAVKRRVEPEVPSKEELEERLSRLPLKARAFLSMLYLTGRRVSEILSLERRNIRFERLGDDKVMVVRVKVAKRKDHPIIEIPLPLSDRMVGWVVEYLNSIGKSRKVFDFSMMTAVRYAKLLGEEFHTHWFRHARLTHLADVMSPYELAEFAKWKSVELAMRYVHSSKRKLYEKIKMV